MTDKDSSTKQEGQASGSGGRAAGYCWERNPHGRGRCTWPPNHSGRHKDVYAGTEW